MSGFPSRLLFSFLHILPIDALHRTIGNPNDAIIQKVVRQCLDSNPLSGFGYGRCPSLLRCTLDNLPSDLTAGMQSGANIASLLPTILAIIGTVDIYVREHGRRLTSVLQAPPPSNSSNSPSSPHPAQSQPASSPSVFPQVSLGSFKRTSPISPLAIRRSLRNANGAFPSQDAPKLSKSPDQSRPCWLTLPSWRWPV